MSTLRIMALTLIGALLVGGCTRNSVAVPSTDTVSASVEGPIRFVTINGQAPDPTPTRHEIPAGPNEITVLYRSYTGYFRCTYEFTAVAGSRYEFVTRANPEPVTLYRLTKENWLISTRHDPVLPRECERVER